MRGSGVRILSSAPLQILVTSSHMRSRGFNRSGFEPLTQSTIGSILCAQRTIAGALRQSEGQAAAGRAAILSSAPLQILVTSSHMRSRGFNRSGFEPLTREQSVRTERQSRELAEVRSASVRRTSSPGPCSHPLIGTIRTPELWRSSPFRIMLALLVHDPSGSSLNSCL